MAEHHSQRMGTTRALITETEYEQLAGEHGDKRRYEATSRVRARVEQRLTEDIAHLAEHHPKLLGEIREVVCSKDETASAGLADDAPARHVQALLGTTSESGENPSEIGSEDVIASAGDQGVTWVTADVETLTASIRNALAERPECAGSAEDDR